MRLRSIETTPNPNSMKLNLDEQLNLAATYTVENKTGCPEFIEKLLTIKGLLSVFVCHDFLTLNKDPRAEWQNILNRATVLLGRDAGGEATKHLPLRFAEKDGQVQVFVQMFRGIPIQLKAIDSQGETRISLGDCLNEAAQLIQAKTGANFLEERYWADQGVRYGERMEVANEVLEEIQGTFNESKLEHAKAEALGSARAPCISMDTLKEWLDDENWHRRLLAVQTLSSTEESLVLLSQAIKDSNPQVRRLAAAALGTINSALAIEPLCDVLLNDKSVGVRRTAGDALSDIGDVAAQPAICHALSDSNKLVRWRAARFLSDIGTPEALPYLEQAADDPEFEVRLEIESARQRINEGAKESGPVWKRIVEQTGVFHEET